MKSIKKAIAIIIILVLLFGFGTALIDYLRMKSGYVPIFCQSEYNSRKKIETFKGFFYRATRKIKTSTSEPLEESSDIKYYLFTLKYDIPSTWKEPKKEYTLKVQRTENCPLTSTLYYANQSIKVYTACLDDIQVVQNNKEEDFSNYFVKNKDFINDVLFKLAYMGLLSDGTIEIYQNRNDGFVSSDIRVYQCNRELINDVYIVPKDMEVQPDFCTYKDDDFKFISEVLDETPEEVEKEYQELKKKKEEAEKEKKSETDGETADTAIEVPEEVVLPDPEVIFEDENYRYEFDYSKSQYVFVTTPAVRGKMETKTPLMTVLNNGSLTIDELINKGLQVNKIDKNKGTE